MKFPSSSKLRLLPITPLISRSGVRPLRCFCWAFFAAFCLLFCGDSRGATQAEVQAAIEAALAKYSDSDGGIYTLPYSEDWSNIGLMLVTSDGRGSVADGVWGMWRTLSRVFGAQYTSDPGYVFSILQILERLESAADSGDTNLVEFLRPFLAAYSSQLNSLEGVSMDISESVSSIASDVSNYGSLWDSIRDSDRWRVHDAELQTALLAALASNGSSVDGISSSLGDVSASAEGAYETLSSINSQLDSIPRNWLTKAQLEDVIDSQEQPPHDEPPDNSAEMASAAQSAQYEWTQLESTSYSNRWELAEWKYTEMLPGNASIVSENPADNPGGSGFLPDDSGIPLFARLVEAQEFGMSIDSSVIEPGDYPVFMSYYNEFRVRWARIFHAVWDFVGAFMVFFIARREWKYYMGVGDNSPEVDSDAGGIF